MSKTASPFILVAISVSKAGQEKLQQEFPDLHFEFRPVESTQEIPDEIWQQVEILFTGGQIYPTAEQSPRLRWVQLISAGADTALKQPILQTGVILTTASGVHAINIAEYVITTILAWYHRLPQLRSLQQQKKWPDEESKWSTLMPEELRGKTIGIVGYGSIGREVARLAQAFGMHILALHRGQERKDHGFLFPGVGDPAGTIPERFYTYEQLHELLEQSDVIVLAVPLTPQTQHMIDREALGKMKNSAFLINIARGEICDQQALIRALHDKRIAGAALDVFTPEPLPEDSPLWQLPNVIISPHVTGLTPHYEERASDIFSANLRRYLDGQPMYNIVNVKQGY